MRKINSFLKSNSLQANRFLTFPFDKTIPVWDNPNLLSFRIFVDAELGNDSNDGLSWNTPVKTLQAADAIIPFDMRGTHALIYIHPGTYEACTFNHTNGVLRLLWGGQAAVNEATGDYGTYCRAGLSNPSRSNDQVIIISSSSNMLKFIGDAEFTIDTRNFSKAWNSAGYVCYDRIVVRAHATSPPTEMIGVDATSFGTEGGLTLDLGGCGAIGLSFWSVKKGLIRSLKIIGGSGQASTQASQFRGAIASFGVESALTIAPISMGWHASFAPPNNIGFELIGIRCIFTSAGSNNCKFAIDITSSNTSYAQGSLPDGNLPQIYLANNFCGSVSYHSSVCSLTDNSPLPHSVKNYSDNISISVLVPALKQKGNYLTQLLQTSAPSDANLGNAEVSFYLDETNNKLMIKLKYSNGTVKSGEITLT